MNLTARGIILIQIRSATKAKLIHIFYLLRRLFQSNPSYYFKSRFTHDHFETFSVDGDDLNFWVIF